MAPPVGCRGDQGRRSNIVAAGLKCQGGNDAHVMYHSQGASAARSTHSATKCTANTVPSVIGAGCAEGRLLIDSGHDEKADVQIRVI